MATQQLSAVSRGTDHQGQCSARTDRGMRTPTGDYMVCAGGHAADDPHGAAFGTSGWFTWTDGQTVSLADRLAHEAASHVTWRARENYLRGLNVNGRIRTAGERLLADMAGEWAQVEVRVEYVSPVSPDGVIYLVVAGLDRRGEALVVMDGQDRAEASAWMDRDYASLWGKAAALFGQPALDLRRVTLSQPQSVKAAA